MQQHPKGAQLYTAALDCIGCVACTSDCVGLCGASSSSSAVASSATGGGSCDGQLDCSLCAECAQNGPCLPEVDACFNDPACFDLVNCTANCFDQACIDVCKQQNPGGAPEYDAAITCIGCDQCANDCLGAIDCGGGASSSASAASTSASNASSGAGGAGGAGGASASSTGP
jgi:hypothetical protein